MSIIRSPRRGIHFASRVREVWQGAAGSVFALLGVAALFVMVFAPPSERFCDVHKIGCSLLTGFVSTALIALGGFFFLFVWTLRRAVRPYVETARRLPDRLFITPPRIRVADMIGRDRLIRDIANEAAFSPRGAAVLLVGEAGAGKTTFLLGLTAYLAERGAVPVPVSLREAPSPLSFRSVARERFLQSIDTQVRSESDAQRVWRRLSAQRRIVVLADGLDEFGIGLPRAQRDQALRSALVAAKNDQLPVVTTSRPEAVPVGAPVSLFHLDPLHEDDTLRYLRSRGRVTEGELGEMRELIAVGEMTRSPFYLDILASMHQAGAPLDGMDHRLPSRDRIRAGLLRGWMDLIETGKLMPDPELGPEERQRILQNLAVLAYVMTVQSAVDCDLQEVHTTLQSLKEDHHLDLSIGIDEGRLIEGAGRLGLLDAAALKDRITIRFHHPITRAYLASRVLGDGAEAWRILLERAPTPESMASIVMWCAVGEGVDSAETVCAALIDRAATLDDDRSLALLVTAAEVAMATSYEDPRKLAEEMMGQAWHQASGRGRLAAIRRLAGRNRSWVIRALYEATRDRSNYAVRWAAAQAIVQAGDCAYEELHSELAGTLDYAESEPGSVWDERRAHDIAVLGWIVPALAVTVSERGSQELDEWSRRLAALVDHGMPTGTESSLAQGFKVAALSARAGMSDVALNLMRSSRFWYTRIVLLHAMCIASIREPEHNKRLIPVIRSRAADRGEHPFVREAARLCFRAIRSGDWTRFVWEDESNAIMQSGSALADETVLLLADLVVLLNLTEQGMTDTDVERNKETTYPHKWLPYCLGKSKDRSHQLFDTCDESCDFNLCPYPESSAFRLARGQFSEVFCQRQIEIASARRRLVTTVRRRPTPWSRSGSAATRRFWQLMESRAG